MKPGVEDRRKVAVACTLCVVALLMLAHWIFGPGSSVSANSVTSVTTAAPSIPSKRKIKANESDSLDPTLHIAQLKLTEHKVYEGTGRNIFESYGQDQAKTTQPAAKQPQKTPPSTILVTAAAPPPLGLKFFGIATALNSPRKACLSLEGDLFIGSEGDIVDRRYKILKIDSNTVDVEDLLKNKQYTLALQQ